MIFVLFGFYLKQQDAGEDILLRAITENLSRAHYDPVALNDDFSEKAFELYLENLDPNKRFFLAKDVKRLQKYRKKIDDETIAGTYELFDLSIKLIEERQEEIEGYFNEILSSPFNFEKKETVDLGEDIDYVKTGAQLKDRWRSYLKYNVLTRLHGDLEADKARVDTGGVAIGKDSLERRARLSVLKTHQDWFKRLNRLSRKERLSLYVNSITAVYDPHTNYYPPKDKANFDIQMSGRLEGIGAQLQEKDGYIKVTNVIPGGPASLQGDLKEGDLILKVAQEGEEAVDIIDWKIDEAVKLIRGKKGTKVTLTVRKADGKEKKIKITRDVVVLEETYAKSLIINDQDNVKSGYIYLPSFYADFNDKNGRFCWIDVKSEIAKLKDAGVQGIILDLRNNGGGSLDDVVKMAGLFIDEGPVVQIKEKDRSPRIMKDTRSGTDWDGALVIMVNEFSASASEIMAAAMQDYDRAVVIGSPKTHGKGTVQRFLALNQTLRSKSIPDLGAIKLTTQKFYRINGDATQLKGVQSDVVLPDYYMYLETGEKEHDYPLEWDQIESSAYTKSNSIPDSIIAWSRARVSSDSIFDLIEENAVRWRKLRDDHTYPLSLAEYNAEQEAIERDEEKYSGITKHKINGFNAANPTTDVDHINSDEARKKRNEDWVNGVLKDRYIYEALQIIEDWNKGS